LLRDFQCRSRGAKAAQDTADAAIQGVMRQSKNFLRWMICVHQLDRYFKVARVSTRFFQSRQAISMMVAPTAMTMKAIHRNHGFASRRRCIRKQLV
jgi:hypothetical protein